MKKFTKFAATTLAAMFALATVVVPAKAGTPANATEDGTAYLNINNDQWADFDAEYTNAVITADGQYTVSMTCSEPQNLAQFNALEVVNGEATLKDAILTIDSITFNGESVALAGSSYTCSADGKGEITRVNLYNEWNSADALNEMNDDLGYVEQRATTDSATAVLWDASYLTKGLTSLEVTFTVSGLGGAEDTEAPAEDTEAPAEDTEAPADDATEAPADDATEAPATEAPTDNSAATGDTAPVAMAVVLMAAAATAIVVMKKEA